MSNKHVLMHLFIAQRAIMEIHQLRMFMAVAKSGGFAPAAASLNVAPSSVTRAIANLEKALGARLFHRTTRSVVLTEEGEQFLGRILPALEELDAAVDQLINVEETVSGLIRVAASVSFGQLVLAPSLKNFNDLYPSIEIELMLSDAVVDLVSERIDIAIRHGALNDSSLIARRLCEVSYRIVATPNYLNASRKISRPEDIKTHSCLTFPYQSFRSTWLFSRGKKNVEVSIQPKARVSNASALAEAVKSGMGIAMLPDWLVDENIASGELTQLLPGWVVSGESGNESSNLWMVLPSRKFIPRKTEAFMKHIQQYISGSGR